ncbi:hypothetical protein CBL_12843 [Carabus blaptoides fortunei]
MARGIHHPWKQPGAFTVCKAAIRGAELAKQMKNVLQTLFVIGLRPIATVCDQAKANVNAVNSLHRGLATFDEADKKQLASTKLTLYIRKITRIWQERRRGRPTAAPKAY